MTQTYEINGRFWRRGEEFIWRGERGILIASSEMLTCYLVTVKEADGQIKIIAVPKGVMGLERQEGGAGEGCKSVGL